MWGRCNGSIFSACSALLIFVFLFRHLKDKKNWTKTIRKWVFSVTHFNEARYESVTKKMYQMTRQRNLLSWNESKQFHSEKAKSSMLWFMCTLIAMIWLDIFLRTCSFDTDLFWAERYPVLFRLILSVFPSLINYWFLFILCVFLHFLILFSWVGKELKNLSRVAGLLNT